ncbi:hypothetical protein MAR_001451 [Mya arenaria]|uniref:Cysteine and tyrosine-rich protein 1 n=1 Tax=Mya arenaria TaxID=6604 RepID=A0ABY7FFX2_MYAAR|nr:uncharacterized protein LOC128209389 [Mya arenaria]WAR19613.1 hypothetical protein MAR_001451 [Mya arenaria]
MPISLSDNKMADILYVLTLAFVLPFVTAGDRCNMYSSTYEYCPYGCCTDYYHSGYEECCDSYSDPYSVAPIGPIIGIVVGCVILVGIVISIIVCCVCCMQKSRGQQGQTFTTAASGPYIMNQMSYGAQMGQTPYGQQQYPAQPPLQTGHMTPGTSVFNNSGMQGPPSYETVVDN